MSTIIATALALASASVPQRCPSQPATVRGSAPTIIAPLVPMWAAAFASAEPSLRLSLNPPFGPPQGQLDPQLAAFLDGKTDFALLTREVAEADLARFKRVHGTAPLIIPVANGSAAKFGYVDPVVFIVNARNPLRSLTFAQIDGLFSASLWRGSHAITDWGKLNGPSWRGRPVHLAGSGAWAGEESARALTVRRHVLTVGKRIGLWRPAPGSGSEADVVERVAVDPQAIGFTGLGHVTPGVRVVPLDGVAPAREAVTTGRYPLSRTVDLLLAPQADGFPALSVRRWARFLVSPAGQQTIRSEGNFLPLRPGQVQHALRLIGPVSDCRR